MEGGEIEEKKAPHKLLGFTIKESFGELIQRPWNLYLILVLGFWVAIAPAVLGYSGTIANSNHVAGALIITFTVIAMSEVGRPIRYILILFGLWLIAAPWIFSTDHEMAKWSGVIAGVVLILLSLRRGKVQDKRGSFDKYIV